MLSSELWTHLDSTLHYTPINNQLPALNIDRVRRDISRYLIFCLLPIRYGEIVHPYRLQQKAADI